MPGRPWQADPLGHLAHSLRAWRSDQASSPFSRGCTNRLCLWLVSGGFAEDVKARVENFLGISSLEITDFMRYPTPQPCLSPHAWTRLSSASLCREGAGSFPGSDILALITQVSLHLRSSVDALLERDR